jgi:hypothetical protein
MKDLYLRLGIEAYATDAQIAGAIARCADASLRQSAETILRSPRRQAYDDIRRQMRLIGQLRADLGLTHQPLWRETSSSDFDAPPSGSSSQLEALRHRMSTRIDKKRGWSDVIRATILLSGLAVAFYVFRPGPPATSEETTTQPNPFDQFDDAPSASDQWRVLGEVPVPQPLPETGVMRGVFGHEGDPVIELKTGDRTGNAFAKILTADSELEVAVVFIRRSESVVVQVPTGRYRIKYASGDAWYGEVARFGPNTAYSRTNRVIEARRYGNVDGVTVILVRQSDGNLPVSQISAEEF